MSPSAAPSTTDAYAAPVAAVSVEQLRFDDVYDEHFAFVWRSVRRLGCADAHVDDVVQEVFLVVYRRLGEFEGRSSLRSWLYGVVSNVMRDHRRTARRKDPRTRGGGDGPDVEALPDPGGRDPQDSLERADAVRVLHDLLGTMEFQKREVFVLVELEQMSVPEVAEAIGVNANTVYSRIRAARQAFNEAAARYRAREERRVR